LGAHEAGLAGLELGVDSIRVLANGDWVFLGAALDPSGLRPVLDRSRFEPELDLRRLGELAAGVLEPRNRGGPAWRAARRLASDGCLEAVLELVSVCGGVVPQTRGLAWSVSEAPLVGRDAALKALQALLTRALDAKLSDAAHTIVLGGRAGSGKSRLLAELVNRAGKQGFSVLAADCGRRAGARPLPLVRLLREAADLGGTPDSAPIQTESALKPVDEQIRLADEFARHLRRAGALRPLLVVVEDADVLDESGAALLGHLVRHVHLEAGQAGPRMRVAVVITMRSGESTPSPLTPVIEELRDDGAVERLRLPVLDDAAAESLVRGLGGVRLSADSGQRVVERAAGNPRLLVELTRLVSDPRHSGRSPSGLRQTLARRIRLEAGPERQVLRVLAALGRPAPVDLVAAAIGATEPGTVFMSLGRLRARRLVRLTRDARFELDCSELEAAVIADLSAAELKALHLRLGELLEQRPDSGVAELARHFYRARDNRRALGYGRRAAEILRREHANEQALLVLGQLLSLKPRPTKQIRIELLEQTAGLHALQGDFARAVSDWRQLVGLGTGSPNLARYWRQLALAYREQGEHETALECLDKGLEVARRRGQAADVLHLLAAKAILLVLTGRRDEAVRLAEEVERADPLRGGPELASALNLIGMVYYRQGRLEEGASYVERALAYSEETGELVVAAKALNNLGLFEYQRGDYRRALEYTRRSLAIKERVGDREAIASSSINLGLHYLRLPDLVASRAALERALALARRIGKRYLAGLALNNIAELDFLEGRYGAALERRMPALRVMERLRALQDIATIQHGLSRTYCVLGDAEQAETLAAKSRSLSQEIGLAKAEALSWVVVGILRRDAGRYAEAAEAFAKAEPMLARASDLQELLWCWTERAELLAVQGDRAAAENLIQRVARESEAGHYLHELAAALLLRANWLAERDPDSAAPVLDRAADLADSLGYRELAWRVERQRALICDRAGRAEAAARFWAAAHRVLARIVEDILDDGLRYGYVQRPDRLEVLRHGRPAGGSQPAQL
jgi:tetratricopeptide (TPR) repeat protein